MAASIETSVVNDEKDKKMLKSNEKQDEFSSIFWKLSAPSENTRENAVIELVERIEGEQKRWKDADSSGPLLEYAVTRLTKGLSSSNKDSRHGFYIALVQLVRLFPQVKIDHVFILVKNSKQGTTDSFIGKSLGYGSLIRSGRLTEDTEVMVKVVSEIISIAARKESLREFCFSLLIELLQNLNTSVFELHVFPSLKSYIEIGFEECTADLLWLVVTCSQKYPDVINMKFLKKHWNVKSLSHEDALDSIAKILLKSSNIVPRIHPVCIEYLVSLLPTDNLVKFWKIITTAAFEKQKKGELYLMFELLREMLPYLTTTQQIREFLLPEFIRTLMLDLAHKQAYLHSVAKQLASGLLAFVTKTEDGNVQLEVLKLLLLTPGSVLFDHVTHTRTVSSMFPHLKSDAVSGLITILKSVFFLKSEEQFESETHRAAALRQLSHLIRYPNIRLESELQIGLLQFLALYAFFTHDAKSVEIPQADQVAPKLSPCLQTTAGECFFHSLADFPKSISVSNNLSLQHHCTVFYGVLHYIDSLLRKPEIVTPLVTWSEDVSDAFGGVINIVAELQKRSDKDGCVVESQAFQILFLHLGLRLFSETKKTLEILSDLHVCCANALKKRRRRSIRVVAKENEPKEEEPEWSQVVVDLLLSLLSENSNWMRVVACQVFTLLVPHLTLASVNQIVDVLVPKPGAVKSSIVNEDSELVQFSSGSESEEEECVNDNEMAVVAEETEVLRNSVKAALGDAAADSEQELSDLDDDAMMQLDDALAKAFRSFMNKNQSSKEKETLIHFQNRCLDMIQMIIKFRPNVTFLLHLLFPLLATAEYGLRAKNSLSLGQKALNCLQKLAITKKFEEDEMNSVTNLDFKQMLEDLVSKSHDVVDNANSQLIGTVCTFVVRCAIYADKQSGTLTRKKQKSEVSKVAECMDVYKQALKDFFDKRVCHTTENIFASLIAQYLNLGWELVDILVNFSFLPDGRLFKKNQAIGMLLALITSPKSVKELIDVDRWADISNDCILKITKSLEEMAKEPKRNHITVLLNLAVNIIKVDANFGRKTEHLESLVEAVKSLRAIKSWHNNTKKLKNDIRRLLNITMEKRTIGDMDANKKKPKKQKKDKLEVTREV